MINVNEDGTIEYILCDVNSEKLYSENIVKTVYESDIIKLSKKNKNIISGLIMNIDENSPIEELAVNDAIEVTALLNDKMYSTTYDLVSPLYYDEDLSNLAHKLMNMSPF